MAGTNLENEELGNSEGVRIPTRIFKTPNDAVNFIVKHIVALIRERKMAGKSCVLGLPTGSTRSVSIASSFGCIKKRSLISRTSTRSILTNTIR